MNDIASTGKGTSTQSIKFNSEYKVKYQELAEKYDTKAGSIDFVDPLKDFNLESLLKDILKTEYAKHGIDWNKFYSGEDLQENIVNKRLKDLGINTTAKKLSESSGEVGQIPNIFITNRPNNHYVDYVQGLRGSDIEKYIAKTVKNLQIAEHTIYDDLEGVVFMLALGGIGGLAVTWFGLTAIGIGFGWGVVGGAVAAAVEMGAAACATVIGAVILAAIGTIFALLNKDAQVLTLILNRTNSNLNITGKYFEHGKLLSEPEAVISIDTDERCSVLAALKQGPYEMVNAGWLNVTKNTGMYGVSGAIDMEFEKPSDFNNNVYLGFEVPYSHISDNNGCNVSLTSYNDAKSYYKSNRKNFSSTGITVNEGDKAIQVYSADKNSSSNSMIAVFQAPLN